MPNLKQQWLSRGEFFFQGGVFNPIPQYFHFLHIHIPLHTTHSATTTTTGQNLNNFDNYS
jgi:hypothetical protein